MKYTEADGPDGTYASNGKPYVTLTLGGVKIEGESDEVAVAALAVNYFPSEKAIALARRTFERVIADHLLNQRAAAVEWRLKPEQNIEHSFGGVFFIRWRARLAVVEKWPLEQAAA